MTEQQLDDFKKAAVRAAMIERAQGSAKAARAFLFEIEDGAELTTISGSLLTLSKAQFCVSEVEFMLKEAEKL